MAASERGGKRATLEAGGCGSRWRSRSSSRSPAARSATTTRRTARTARAAARPRARTSPACGWTGPGRRLVARPRGARVDEALEALGRYLDDAALAGLEQVLIIHGLGTERCATPSGGGGEPPAREVGPAQNAARVATAPRSSSSSGWHSAATRQGLASVLPSGRPGLPLGHGGRNMIPQIFGGSGAGIGTSVGATCRPSSCRTGIARCRTDRTSAFARDRRLRAGAARRPLLPAPDVLAPLVDVFGAAEVERPERPASARRSRPARACRSPHRSRLPGEVVDLARRRSLDEQLGDLRRERPGRMPVNASTAASSRSRRRDHPTIGTSVLTSRMIRDQSGADEASDSVSVFGSLLLLPIQTPTAVAGTDGSSGGASSRTHGCRGCRWSSRSCTQPAGGTCRRRRPIRPRTD